MKIQKHTSKFIRVSSNLVYEYSFIIFKFFTLKQIIYMGISPNTGYSWNKWIFRNFLLLVQTVKRFWKLILLKSTAFSENWIESVNIKFKTTIIIILLLLHSLVPCVLLLSLLLQTMQCQWHQRHFFLPNSIYFFR